MSDSMKDRVDGAKDKVVGSVKEAAGKATNDQHLEDEGKVDQAKGDAKGVIADVKDKVSGLFNNDKKN